MDALLIAVVAGVACALTLRLVSPRTSPKVLYVQAKPDDELPARSGGSLLFWALVALVLYLAAG